MRTYMKLMLLLIIAAGLIAGCQSADKQSEKPAEQLDPMSLDSETVLARNASKQLVMSFTNRLKGELMAAIAAHEPAGAIGVCKEVAPAIADSTSTDGWIVRRVTDKFRNPDNRATLAELEIMARFNDSTAPRFVEHWEKTDSSNTYYYYEPIRVGALCLNCHGELQTLAPGVMQAVRKQYPSDKATGYQVGDLRGMFVVTADWPEAEGFARELVNDSL